MGALASPRVGSPSFPASPFPKSLWGGLLLTPARPGDHVAVLQLMQESFRGPSTAEYQAQLEEPGYAPGNRLVVLDGPTLVAHARLSFRDMVLGDACIPVARVFDLCTRPEYRGQRLATSLLAACEQLARERGAALLQSRSARPGMFQRLGWCVGDPGSYHLVKPREVLAEVERCRWERAAQHQPSDDLPQLNPARHPLLVRRWKQTEYAAVQRLFAEACVSLNGPLTRDDEYWRWLIARQAYDWLYVAIDGPDRTLFDDIQGNIVGYMFLKSNRMVELVASSTEPRAAEALLVRACRDAVEQSPVPMRLVAPPYAELENLILASGSKTNVPCDQDSSLLKVLDLPRLASAALQHAPESLRASFELREDPDTIPIHREESAAPERLLLEGAKLSADHSLARPQAICSRKVFVRLLLGQQTLEEALFSSQLQITSRQVREVLEQALPPRRYWQPILDDLLAE
jgi:predicted N-acetyltransferase YhbS